MSIPRVTKADYLLAARSASDSSLLRDLAKCVEDDDTLPPGEKDQIGAAIDSRYSQINREAIGTAKPRWP